MMIPNDLIKTYVTPMVPQPTDMTSGGQLQQRIKCILFDIYGTLFISGAGDISLARKISPEISRLKHLLAKFEVDLPPRLLVKKLHQAIKAQHRQLIKRGTDNPEIKIDEIWLQILATDDIERARHFAIEYELIANPVFPMPHLSKLLTACRQQNCHMGLVSNAQFFTTLLFEWFLGADTASLGFDSELIFLSYQMGCAKPSMALFQTVARAVNAKNIATDAALFVGNDMLNDIYPAKQVGFQTALFAGDARSLRLRTEDPRCRNLQADITLTDLKQLIGYIT